MAKVKYKARYRKKGANPFTPHISMIPKDSIVSKTVEIDESVPIKRVQEMAKEATPGGYEFIEVECI